MRLRLCILGFIALLLAMTSSELCTADSEFPRPFDIEFEPSTSLKTDEPVTMRLSIQRSEDPGKTIELDFSGQRGLTLPDGASRSAELDGDGKVTVEFDVVIPKGDTSSITVVIKRDYLKMKTKRWFVTTGESVRYWKAHPREANPEDAAGPPPGRRGRIIPGEFPDLDSAYGIPPEMIHPDYREQDSTQTRIYEPLPTKVEMDSAILEKQRRHLHELEQTPLTEYGRQLVKVGDTIWIRNYGETKFRVAEKVRDLEAHMQAVTDSIAAIPPETMFDVLYFVKDSSQLANLQPLIKDLLPTRQEGVYQCRISQALIKTILDRYGIGPTYPDVAPEVWRELFDSEPSPDSGDPDQEGRLDDPDKGTEIFYSENYENGWPPSVP